MHGMSKKAQSNNTITLTDLYAKLASGVVLAENDPPPERPAARPIELDYPHISTQPEYAAEREKLNRFSAQRDAATVRLEELREKLRSKVSLAKQTDEQMISKAESLLAGGPSEEDLPREIEETVRLIEALGRAILAQHGVLTRVRRELSRAAGRRYLKEHKQRVKRMIAAVIELHAANQAELDLHHDLIRLGYTEGALTSMSLHRVEDPCDPWGNVTTCWHREAANYVKTEAEIASGVRKARLAAVLQNSDNSAAAVDNPATNQ